MILNHQKQSSFAKALAMPILLDLSALNFLAFNYNISSIKIGLIEALSMSRTVS